MKKLSLLFLAVLLFSVVSVVYAGINEELLKASEEGNVEAIRTLLDKGVDVNAKDDNGTTALMGASKYGHTDTVKLLIENGADVNAKDNNGVTALMSAFIITELWNNDIKVKLFPEKGEAKLLGDRGGTATPWEVFYNGKTDTVKLLIEKGADINAKSNKGNTALMLASRFGYTNIAKLLIEKGADVNMKNNAGDSALMIAYTVGCTATTAIDYYVGRNIEYYRGGYADIAKLLIENGADINAKDKDGYTALMTASRYGKTDIVKTLIENGVDVNAKTNNSWTALMLASLNGHTDIVELLKQAGAKE